ncbi:EAL domain-containing protein [Amphritea sp.]|uniref:two-component system response regulator n=1 Tax=Amphritea sp. TaxID=1872502 RepID=UPI003A9539BD
MSSRCSSAKPLLLMVDDVPSNIHVLAQSLKDDFDIMIATDGPSALSLVHEKERPDLILLDVMMPGMDGYEVCKLLQSHSSTSSIPVIFVTAKSDVTAEEYGLKLGAVDYITKPFTTSVVRARVNTHLKLKSLVRQLEEANQRLSDKLSLLQQQHEKMLTYSTELAEVRERQKLFSQVFESTNDGVMITDIKGNIIAVNNAFTQVSGYSEAEVIGLPPRMLRSGRHDQTFYSEMWKSIKSTGHWTGEVWNKKKSGELFLELLTISAVLDDDGRIKCYIGVFSDITQLREVQQRMDFLTWHDPLTSLPNRLLFTDRLSQLMGSTSRQEGLGSLLVFGLQRFSDLCVTRGSALGDKILHDLSKELQDYITDGNSLARLEGDQFALLLPQVHSSSALAIDAAHQQADAIQQLVVRFSSAIENDLFQLRAAVGVAIYPDAPDEAVTSVISRAETAYFRAKSAGSDGGPAVFFESSMGERIEQRLTDEHRLRLGIQNDQLRVYLQSQVCSDGRLHGAEALVRWEHPDDGLISPAMFIPLAEGSDLIVQIDRWMIDQVSALLGGLRDSHPALKMSVNVSSRCFQCDDFVDYTQQCLQRYNANPAQLVIEVTESTMLDNIDRVVGKMIALADSGVSFSIDDFGTGYSSLFYLKSLPLAELKIDQSFIRDMLNDAGDAELVNVIQQIASRFDLSVVAEGVETEEQAEYLRQNGRPLMQGYLFSIPEPASEWLKRIEPCLEKDKH